MWASLFGLPRHWQVGLQHTARQTLSEGCARPETVGKQTHDERTVETNITGLYLAEDSRVEKQMPDAC